MFLELNSKGLYQSSGKEKKVVVLCSRPGQNVNSGTFTLQSGIDGKEMYRKSVVHVQSCCVANLILLLFCRSGCRPPRRCVKLPSVFTYRHGGHIGVPKQ